MIRKGTDVTHFDEQQTFTYDDIHIFYPLTDELTMVQAKFTRKVSGRVGVKPRWLDSQFRTTAPTQREVRTWAELLTAHGSAA